MSEQPPPSKRIRLSKDDLRHIAKEDLIARWLEQETYLNALEDTLHRSDLGLADELSQLRSSETQLKMQLQDVKKRENVLVLKLAAKEQEANEYRNHIQRLKTMSTPSVTQLKSLLLDPAVNLMFQRMKTEVKDAKKKEKEAQEDLAAWKFTPDSQTGKRLMARCRSLLQENESIGKMIASGRVAKIEGELALQRRLVDEMKTGQADLDVFIAELDEDVEGMQSTIYLLQQQLREARTQMAQLQTENELLKSGVGGGGGGDTIDAYKASENHSNHQDSKKQEEEEEKDEEAVREEEVEEEETEKKQQQPAAVSNEDNGESHRDDQDDTDDDGRNAAMSTAAIASSQLESGPRRRDDEDRDEAKEDEMATDDTEAKGPSSATEESVFTLTVKDSERQELEDGFGDKEDDDEDDRHHHHENNDIAEEREEEEREEEESGKQTAVRGSRRNSSAGGTIKHDSNHFSNNNGAAVKRPHSPGDDDNNKNSKGGKTNGNDVSAGQRSSSRSNNVAASSPAKKARGAGRSARGRRASVDDAEDDHEAAEDRAAPTAKGRSPRAGSRVGSGTRATRGSGVVANGDATAENGMDCD